MAAAAVVLLVAMVGVGVPPIPLVGVGSIVMCVGFHLALDPRDPTGERLLAMARRSGKGS